MCHVLIIENEALIALNIQVVLEENGATSFDLAETEDDAVAAARAHRPDVITADVKLRRGNGPSAVRTILQALGGVPVIFITASPDDCDFCAPPGVVLGKPLVEATVARAFRNAIAV